MRFSSFDKDIKGRQKRNGNKESPWKVPEFIFIGFNLRLPFWWVRYKVAFHNLFIERKFIKTGEILSKSKTFNIKLYGTLSKALW